MVWLDCAGQCTSPHRGVNSFEYPNSWGFDFVSGYKHKPIPAGLNLSLEELRKGGYVMDEKQWMTVRLELLPSSPVWSDGLHPSESYSSSPLLVYPGWSQPLFATSRVFVLWYVSLTVLPVCSRESRRLAS
jgi:hypothetical protein